MKVQGLEYVSHLALKKKKGDDPQRFTITLEGIDIDEIALIGLRGKTLNLDAEDGSEPMVMINANDIMQKFDELMQQLRDWKSNVEVNS